MRAINAKSLAGMLVLLLALSVVLGLSACGRKGAPEAPPGSTYPGNYPQY